jgi:hypothetical protein
LGGSSLLQGNYGGSLHLLLSNVYPDYEWLPWKFSQVPKGYWADLTNQRKFLDWVAVQFNITNNHENREGWYKLQLKVTFNLKITDCLKN